MYLLYVLAICTCHVLTLARVCTRLCTCVLIGVPSLKQLQDKKKREKKKKTSGVSVKNLLQFKMLLIPLKMPTPTGTLTLLEDLQTFDLIKEKSILWIPQDEFGVEGCCLTGPKQIQWIGQLLDMPHKFVLHADGKHKLHHGGWIMMTVGTHHITYVLACTRLYSHVLTHVLSRR